MIRFAGLVAVLACGCTAFDSRPVDRVAEQRECLALPKPVRYMLCHDYPPELAAFGSILLDCKLHARDVVTQARTAGLRAYYVVGDVYLPTPARHVVAVIETADGRQWVIDNGRIASYPFPVEWLRRHMRWIAQTTDYELVAEMHAAGVAGAPAPADPATIDETEFEPEG